MPYDIELFISQDQSMYVQQTAHTSVAWHGICVYYQGNCHEKAGDANGCCLFLEQPYPGLLEAGPWPQSSLVHFKHYGAPSYCIFI